MSYLQTNGHTNALAEPNSPTQSSVAASIAETIAAPSTQKSRTPLKEKKELTEKKERLFTREPEEVLLTTLAEEETRMAEAAEAAEIMVEKEIPFRIEKNKVFGRYTGQFGPFEMMLRIDIDGFNPLLKVSGEYFLISGQTKSYFGSFLADGITASIANGMIMINGTAKTSWSTSYTRLKITIKQTSVFQALSPAMLQWYHASTNTPGAMYVCNNTGRAFRTAQLEQDCVEGVTPFISFNTGVLPSGGPDRVLSINTAYQEAGVDMITAGITNTMQLSVSGLEARWSNAELHCAMMNHFSTYEEKPEWAIWLLHAGEHSYGPGLHGIMFNQPGFQQQACAIFYKSLAGTSPEKQRQQLYTCIHELGHCFNLAHTWQKSYATPPKPNIPDSLSWMNYPQLYPGGPSAFWNEFSFQFDPVEVTHLRHGFRPNLIRSRNPFTMAAASSDIGVLFEDNVENKSSLVLKLEARRSYLLGEPVFLETQLRTTSMINQQVNSLLHADFGFITIGIKKPGGEILVYEPVAEMDSEPSYSILNATQPAVYQSSYIGFGRNGFIFDQVGTYQLRAVYYHRDGSRIISDTLAIRVNNPVTADDNELANLMLNNDVGYLLAFMGSDAPYLQKANDSLDVLLTEKFKDHPLAVYVQYIKGVNAQRTFKTITADKKIYIRKPDFEWGQALLKTVINKSKAGRGLDNIALQHCMHKLAKSYQRAGNHELAEESVRDITTHFNSLPLKQHVKDNINRQSATILSADR
ncbi:hypothetical protein A3860_23175 [Niastella vici]|uniref:Uncharacterized protein n=1 Tax=Niastella vici TaxID=1703345 RepID=A0A1V9FZS4_9BACT|nr:hypothetical protein [Niastella vici]OQP63843.1 hypothetical protein A3860_23175 [Niastella vici]